MAARPKNVWLHVTGQVYQTLPLYSNLGTTGVYVYDIQVKSRTATVHAESEVRNETRKPANLHYEVAVFDYEGKQVADFQGKPKTVAAGATATLTVSADMHDLHFWNWNYGYLYNVRSHEGDRYYLLATDLKVQTQGFETVKGSLDMVVWESTDLVNWSAPRLVDLGARAFIREDGRHLGCFYAPEAIYDDVTGEYVVFWASRTYPNYPETLGGRRYKVFYSRTRDFVHFTPGRLYIERGADGNIIDTSMLRAADGKYYRVSADGLMNIEQADYILGEWRKVADLTNLHKLMKGYEAYRADTGVELRGKVVEGPELFQFNNEAVYGLYSDNYQRPGMGYIPVTTTDLSDPTGQAWQLYTRDQYTFGKQRKRHGSILDITREEYEALLAKWGDAR